MENLFGFIKQLFRRRTHLEESLFNDLDLRQFLKRSLTLCLEQSSASMAIWIDQSEYEKICQHRSEEKFEEGQAFSQGLKICATAEIKVEDVVKKIHEFDLENSMLQIQDQQLLMPVMSHDRKSSLGYWLLLGVPAGRSKTVALSLSALASKLSKHFGFCLQYQKARNESFLDDLTGLYNQKYLAMSVENEIHRCSREKEKFSVLFMDIDYFKSVNDKHGHWIGSRLLIELGQVVSRITRRSDYCFRYGGDEFVVLLANSDQEGAVVAAERIRKTVEEMDFIVDGMQFNITMSIGIATYPDHAISHKDIIQMADEAMYCGKNKSRNIVFMAS